MTLPWTNWSALKRNNEVRFEGSDQILKVPTVSKYKLNLNKHGNELSELAVGSLRGPGESYHTKPGLQPILETTR